MAIVFLGLGSNLGNRHQNIIEALKMLEQKGIKIIKVSRFIETDPVGLVPQGLFINGCVKIETNLLPEALLDVCWEIESLLGRVRTMRNGPRTIDIDILLYDDITMNTEKLTIPHPRMYEREFVMIPLKEIL